MDSSLFFFVFCYAPFCFCLLLFFIFQRISWNVHSKWRSFTCYNWLQFYWIMYTCNRLWSEIWLLKSRKRYTTGLRYCLSQFCLVFYFCLLLLSFSLIISSFNRLCSWMSKIIKNKKRKKKKTKKEGRSKRKKKEGKKTEKMNEGLCFFLLVPNF